MARIKMHIPKAKLPFYPPCEVKCMLQNGVSTVSFSKDQIYPNGIISLLVTAGTRGVHGSSWVRLRGFFDPTHHGGSKKFQPNPSLKSILTHMGRVEPMGLTILFYYYY